MCGGEEKESNLTRTLNPLGETKCSGWSGFTVRASVDRVFGYDWIWCSRWGGFYTLRGGSAYENVRTERLGEGLWGQIFILNFSPIRHELSPRPGIYASRAWGRSSIIQ